MGFNRRRGFIKYYLLYLYYYYIIYIYNTLKQYIHVSKLQNLTKFLHKSYNSQRRTRDGVKMRGANRLRVKDTWIIRSWNLRCSLTNSTWVATLNNDLEINIKYSWIDSEIKSIRRLIIQSSRLKSIFELIAHDRFSNDFHHNH